MNRVAFYGALAVAVLEGSVTECEPGAAGTRGGVGLGGGALAAFGNGLAGVHALGNSSKTPIAKARRLAIVQAVDERKVKLPQHVRHADAAPSAQGSAHAAPSSSGATQ